MSTERVFGEVHQYVAPTIEDWPLIRESKILFTAVDAAVKAGEMLYKSFNTDYPHRIKEDNSDFTPFDEEAEKIAKGVILESEPDATIMGEEMSADEDITNRDSWVIDGIDGTTNYRRKLPFTNFTLAKVECGRVKVGVVYDFLHEGIYYAEEGKGAYKNGRQLHVADNAFEESVISFAPLRNIRSGMGDFERESVEALWQGMREITEQSGRFHRELQSGGLELAFIASGQLDGYASSWTSPWDLSAGVLLVREAGGVATNILGEEWQPSYWGVIAGSRGVHEKMLSILRPIFMRQIAINKERESFYSDSI